MRPRHFASENFAGLICTRKPHWSFNEAEAFCLGKRWDRAWVRGGSPRFNEAEAFCLGKHKARNVWNKVIARFNEAEAFCLGKPSDVRDPSSR